jgi:hypothetical protein
MKGEIMTCEKMRQAVQAIVDCFTDDEVPEDFRFEGQDFYQRCESWTFHAVQQLENELFSPDEPDDEDDEIIGPCEL